MSDRPDFWAEPSASSRTRQGVALRRRLSAIVSCLVANCLLVISPLCAPAQEQEWKQSLNAGSFILRADYQFERSNELLGELRRLRTDLVHVLGVEPNPEIVELYLFESKSRYRDYLRREYPQVPVRRALFIKGNGPGMVFAYQQRDFDVDLRHECTHALLHTAVPVLPLWLDEGLAEYFEVPAAERAHGNPHLTSVKRNLWIGVSKLKDLEAKQQLQDMSRRDYRDSWAWVHFMLHGPSEARGELTVYLQAIRAGQMAEPLSDRLARRIPDVDQRLAEHFKGWRRQ